MADSNGPVFMPNTRTMQQMARYDYERYKEDVQDGKSVTSPLILRIDGGKISTLVKGRMLQSDQIQGLVFLPV